VVGFDDIPQAGYFFPPLTTVSNPIFDLGRRAAELVLDTISGKIVPDRTVLPVEVIIRQSTGPVSKTFHRAGDRRPYFHRLTALAPDCATFPGASKILGKVKDK